MRSALVISEVSLAVLLLVGAALMIRTVQHLVAVDPGFDPDRVLAARVSIPRRAADQPSDGPGPLVVSARLLLDRSERCRASPTRASSRIRRSPGWTPRCSTRPRDKA